MARLKKPGKDEPVDPEKAAMDRQIADFERMEQIRARCNQVVKDPKTAEALKRWYNQLCKYPCFHDAYLQTFNRPSVHLVDTDGKAIEDIIENGVIANGEPIEPDALVFATGFELATSWSHRTNTEITGPGGEKISEHWADGTRTLHGWTTRFFPNCFFIQVFHVGLGSMGIIVRRVTSKWSTSKGIGPSSYNTHTYGVLYAGLHMNGSAFHWFEPVMVDHLTTHSDQQDEETKAIFGNFNVFEARLKQIFGTPGEEQAAAQRGCVSGRTRCIFRTGRAYTLDGGFTAQ
ncbi:hypothetical protein LTR93_011184 [Exophiala xenobiotica]|nr:hypothetical protein LTR93_011184 [Exophiala xenobiotica]